ncbi:MAG: phosphoribosylformylglycinamidine synthase [Fibromonadaceae bacterium]|jgi:phosphoribosylformylglycinamidine synthase|nr:phosphoribosylformylglycinamidine synthase [Fibromonadaceae bacterium]
MLFLPGPRAVSNSKLSQFSVKGLNAEYLHIAKTSRDLTVEELEKLKTLLDYGSQIENGDTSKSSKSFNQVNQGSDIIVAPRLGTISVWSSRATDLAHICGLDAVIRLERVVLWSFEGELPPESMLFDRMTEQVFRNKEELTALFECKEPKPLARVPVSGLKKANVELGLALSDDEIDYLTKKYTELKKEPSDVELMMFAQANSEHCRHKIFNAEWEINGEKQDLSLFEMIKNTYKCSPHGILSAYKDNAAVMEGYEAERFYACPTGNEYNWHKEPVHILMKVETHNHPTAISSFPAAATGSGGEIRDEGATGVGSKPKAGLCGFSVSNLKIPGYIQPWERDFGKPGRIESPLQIMLSGPLGAAEFNNDFGRPNLCGYFRTFEQEVNGEIRGYHKPIMLAGGIGNIKARHVQKGTLKEGDLLIVLGGPAMLIGLGGGAASSIATVGNDEELDFASVQRGNPEIQRRCQEVIDRCWALEDKNPIAFIHDVGAGGLSNALPELVKDAGFGGTFRLRDIPNADPSLSPLEIWCNEAQERYVLAISKENLPTFQALCERERCPFAIVGEATTAQNLILSDTHFENTPIDIPLNVLLGNTPRMRRSDNSLGHTPPFGHPSLTAQPVAQEGNSQFSILNSQFSIQLEKIIHRVLSHPAVADKSFLITIGDRSATGMVVREQMVGPWQVPVADCAVTTSTPSSTTGEAYAMGERTPLALLNSGAAARMAVAEAITNIAAAKISDISKIKLSANWMANPATKGEGAALYEAVQAVGMDFCPKLGIAIPVGKDSMSMSMNWMNEGEKRTVTAPVSLIVSAFAPCEDVCKSLTPELQNVENTILILADLGQGKNRMGGSIANEVFNQFGGEAPDADPDLLKQFFNAVQTLNEQGKVLAYHDRSDGGIFTTLVEMAFAGNVGVELRIENGELRIGEPVSWLFNEELGAVLQVRESDFEAACKLFPFQKIGTLSNDFNLTIKNNSQFSILNSQFFYREKISELRKIWSRTSYEIAKLRDNPECAKQEYEWKYNEKNIGIKIKSPYPIPHTPYPIAPRIAILRDQGTNGSVETAAAFDKAGFKAVDVHTSDILSGKMDLSEFSGLAVCGSSSFGNVLGAGAGWAKSILFNERAKEAFQKFFERKDTFTLGTGNGCQMLSNLKSIIPGAAHWPKFMQNISERFEARFVSVKIENSPSLLLKGMENFVIPVPVAHGEGRVEFANLSEMEKSLVALRYVDNNHEPTEMYPLNPNGSLQGITGLTSEDGRVLIMMPHPERAFRMLQNTWTKPTEGDGYWMQLFRNARELTKR